MFDESFRVLFLSTPAKLSHRSKNLIISSQERGEVSLPLKDISTIIIDTPQITLNASVLNAMAKYKILLFVCDESHLPSGNFLPYLSHYRNSQILQHQINLSKQRKSVLWQKIIKAKISNQAQLLKIQNQTQVAKKLEALSKSVHLNDSSNNEAKASMLYFPALFGKGFARNENHPINSALNYGYAIVRSVVVRNIVGSGLLPSLGIFHANQFNPFNLADDLIEPYRPYVDSKVLSLDLGDELELHHRVELINILHTCVALERKVYPLHRAITRSIWSLSRYICQLDNEVILPILDEVSNGREIYESVSDV